MYWELMGKVCHMLMIMWKEWNYMYKKKLKSQNIIIKLTDIQVRWVRQAILEFDFKAEQKV